MLMIWLILVTILGVSRLLVGKFNAYIHYCRTHCHPRLSESAASGLQENYVKIRQDMRRQANETGEAAAIPITVRQLEAVVRLSEALARMRLLFPSKSFAIS